MAGKKKGNDDAGMSKTARASALKKGGKQEGFIPAAPENLDRVQSLNGGNYVRILKATDGKSLHLRVGSVAYFDALTSVGNSVVAELARKGFPVEVENVD